MDYQFTKSFSKCQPTMLLNFSWLFETFSRWAISLSIVSLSPPRFMPCRQYAILMLAAFDVLSISLSKFPPALLKTPRAWHILLVIYAEGCSGLHMPTHYYDESDINILKANFYCAAIIISVTITHIFDWLRKRLKWRHYFGRYFHVALTLDVYFSPPRFSSLCLSFRAGLIAICYGMPALADSAYIYALIFLPFQSVRWCKYVLIFKMVCAHDIL